MMRHPLLRLMLALLALFGVSAVFAQEGSTTYTVARGDVLDLIAAAYDVDTRCLAKANALENPGKLRVGDTLLIDLSCPVYTGPAFVPNPRQELRAPVTADQGGGGEDRPRLQPGPDDQVYTVQRGDVLDLIAQRFNVSVVSLQLANELPSLSARLFVGDELIIPAGAPPYGQFPALPVGEGQGGGAVADPGDQVHVVQPGDVLDLIGAAYDTQVACIIEANGLLKPGLIFAGQSVVIPASCPRYDGQAVVTNPRG